MRKNRKVTIIISVSILCVLLVFLGLYVGARVLFGRGNVTVTSLDKYLALCETDGSLPAVPEDEFRGYNDLDFRYEQHLSMLSDERWLRMTLSYDEKTYAEQTARIDESYDFASGAASACTGGYSPDFSFGGFEFKTCSSNVYPKSMCFIGFNKAEQKLCYLYFEDGELDLTDDFPLFFRQHKFIAE